MTVRIATTSDIGHWFRNDSFFYKGAVQVRAGRCGHRPLRRVTRGAVWRDDVGIVPYGWYAGCENRARSCSVPGEVSLLYFYRSHSGRARFWMPETMPMAANKVTMEVPP